MRAVLVLAALATLSGCSTVASRRDDPPDLVQETSKSVAEFRTCFLPQFDKSNYPVSYVPTARGESYHQGLPQGLGGTYMLWVLDIEDLGTRRRVTLHAIHSMWGPDKKLAAKVAACLLADR